MTPERHAQIQAIFEAALDLPVPRRSAYVQEICGNDPELRSQVSRLIEAAGEDDDSGDPTLDATLRSFVRSCPACSRCYDGATMTCSEDGTPLQVGFPGRLLVSGKYLIERQLGHGGMGAVYLVRHVGLEKYFALKLILANGAVSDAARRRFETEAHALGRMKHPNIVDVTDYGLDQNAGGMPYLVMEYLEGRPLTRLMKDRKSTSFPKLIDLLRGVATAIDTANQQNIVHGDLKPANIFLVRLQDSREIPKVVDFGLARLGAAPSPGGPLGTVGESGDALSTGHVRGTPAYMAPELFRGEEATASSDRFAFGVTVYELITGHSPFGRQLWEVREKQQHDPIPPSQRNPELPPELDVPVLALLDPDSEKRPATALEAVENLERAWLAAERKAWRERESPRRLVIAFAAAILLVFLAALSSRASLLRNIEHRLSDARFAMLPKHPPDPRLLVVSVDDATVAENRPPLADRAWADEFGRIIEAVFAAGARGVAIDLLLPASWASSQQFESALARHAGRITLALFSTPTGSVIGPEAVSPLTANLIGPQRYNDLFGFVNLPEDEDGAIRRAGLSYVDRSGLQRQSFAPRAAETAGLYTPFRTAAGSPLWIDYSVRPQDFPKIAWKDVGARLGTVPETFRGKLVLIGADYAGSGDVHKVPETVSADLLPGILLQALVANAVAEKVPIRSAGSVPTYLTIGLLCFAILALAMRFPYRFAIVITASLVAAALYAAFAFAVFRSSRIMFVLVGPETAMLLSVAAAWILKSRLPPYPTAERLAATGD